MYNYNEHREADAAKQQQHSAAVDIFYSGARAAGVCYVVVLILWLHQQKQTFSVCTLSERAIAFCFARSARSRAAKSAEAVCQRCRGDGVGRLRGSLGGDKMHAVPAA